MFNSYPIYFTNCVLSGFIISLGVGCSSLNVNNLSDRIAAVTEVGNVVSTKVQWSNSIRLSLPKIYHEQKNSLAYAHNRTSSCDQAMLSEVEYFSGCDQSANTENNLSHKNSRVYTNRIPSCDNAPLQDSSAAYLSLSDQLTKPEKQSRRESRLVYIQAVSTLADDNMHKQQLVNCNDVNLYRVLKSSLLAKDYQISRDPEKVLAILQVRLKQAGMLNYRIVQHSLTMGYGAEILKPELSVVDDMTGGGRIDGAAANIASAHKNDDNNILEHISNDATGITNYTPHPDVENVKVATEQDKSPKVVGDNAKIWTELDKSHRDRVGNFVTSEKRRSSKRRRGRLLSPEQVFSVIADVQVLVLQQDSGWLRQRARLAVYSDQIKISEQDLMERIIEDMANEIAGLF